MSNVEAMPLHGLAEPPEPSLVGAADEVVEALVVGGDAHPALAHQ